jgi:hypothetical protein
MYHYLEHTREPLAELRAADRVLVPGGYLVIEVPDPDCLYGRLLGARWISWFQPQHLHFLSLGNLRAALEGLGFTVCEQQRGPCHIPTDLTFALYSCLSAIAPPVHLPWRAPDPSWRQAWRALVVMVAGPFLGLALLADQALGRAAAWWEWPSNTFRVLARKQSDEGEGAG